jgi:hypothetical protein
MLIRIEELGDDKAMAALAVVGDAGSREILREYADDAELGAAAIAAIRYLSGEQG